jgi:hypothetical protein
MMMVMMDDDGDNGVDDDGGDGDDDGGDGHVGGAYGSDDYGYGNYLYLPCCLRSTKNLRILY